MSKTVIFIDFDDTLFPTEWVQSSNININNPNETLISLFSDLDTLITDMVIKMTFLGDVLIVTNGSSSWVNNCLKVLPTFKQVIDNGAVSVTSARDLFQDEHDKGQWKRLTFQLHFNEHISDHEGRHHILSFGDSSAEHDAVLELKNYNAKENQERIIKSIKFIEQPSLNQLVVQLQTINVIQEEIIQKDEDYVFNLGDFIL